MAAPDRVERPGAARPKTRPDAGRVLCFLDPDLPSDQRERFEPDAREDGSAQGERCPDMSAEPDTNGRAPQQAREFWRRRILDLHEAQWSSTEIAEEVPYSERHIRRVISQADARRDLERDLHKLLRRMQHAARLAEDSSNGADWSAGRAAAYSDAATSLEAILTT